MSRSIGLFTLDKQRYEMVVIVQKDVRNIWDVKGKRFCHPGLDATDDWTNAFSTVNAFIVIYNYSLYTVCPTCKFTIHAQKELYHSVKRSVEYLDLFD